MSSTVDGGRSFRKTPPSISDWIMPRLTSSARLGCGLNIQLRGFQGAGFHGSEQEPFQRTSKQKGTTFRRTNQTPGCREYAHVGADALVRPEGEAERPTADLVRCPAPVVMP